MFPQKGCSSPLLPCHTAQDSKSIALSPGSPSSAHRRGVQRSYVNLCTEEGEPGDKASKSMCQGFNCKVYSSLHLTIPTLINLPVLYQSPLTSHTQTRMQPEEPGHYGKLDHAGKTSTLPVVVTGSDEYGKLDRVCVYVTLYTVEPLVVDTLKSGQPPYNGQTVCPFPVYCL